jgi:pantoate--beta-alanine ligase
MGCLHEGHASLIRKARELADVVVVSIYVNPLQFGPNEDMDAYPRTFETDKAACKAEGADIIFHPENLYTSGQPNITLKVVELSDVLCGSARPGHFDGVVTVVNILFNIVQPDIALFGEKDWQQLAIIRRMVTDLHMPVEIVGCETVREPDGLAMSSRNRYLSAEERKRAIALHASIQKIVENAKNGDKNCKNLLKTAINDLKVKQIDPEYIEIRDAFTLVETARITDQPTRAFIAATIGKARLIDNISLHCS